MKAHIITIGDEILIGQVVDTNSAWMGQQLNLLGATLNHIDSISDEAEDIQAALGRALQTADLILMTGGLGPTKDDITKKAIADFFGVALEFHQPTYDRILRIFERLGRETTPAHKAQCYMPANATLLRNKMGSAPGMWFEHEDTILVSMPGVPYEMKSIMQEEVFPRLKNHFKLQTVLHRTILTVGEGESRIAARIEDIEDNLPKHIKLAFLPNLGKVRLRLSTKGANEQALQQELNHYVQQIEARIPELVFGHDKELLEEVVGRTLQERGLSLTTAESCTGGFLAHKITSVPGSSAYFMGSIIAYANDVKVNQLRVKPETLATHGAVSEATVKEMVVGALQLMHTDIAIAVSGVAGPGGGTPEKPVGTVWLAVGNNEQIQTRKLQIGKDRLKNIQYATVQALNMIRKFVLQEYPNTNN
ncbi:MAG: competence/damage-inducible protein A [Bacteroidota bacterium]